MCLETGRLKAILLVCLVGLVNADIKYYVPTTTTLSSGGYNESATNITIGKWSFPDTYANANCSVEEYVWGIQSDSLVCVTFTTTSSTTTSTTTTTIPALCNPSFFSVGYNGTFNNCVDINGSIQDVIDGQPTTTTTLQPYNETAVNITIAANDRWVDTAGDTMTGNLVTKNITIEKELKSANSINIKPSNENDDYLVFSVGEKTANVPEMKISGDTRFYVESSESLGYLHYGITPQVSRNRYYTEDGFYLDIGKENETNSVTYGNGNSFLFAYGGSLVLRTTDGVIMPYANKAEDLGSAAKSFDDCFCDDYTTTSRGWKPKDNKTALQSIKTLKTNAVGEIDHSLQDESFAGEGENTTSLNAVIMAQNEAIQELHAMIEELQNKKQDKVNQ